MPVRPLPVALLVLIACATAAGLALRDSGRGSEATTTAAAATLLRVGGGPSGSGEVALRRWRLRADPRDRGRRGGWASGRWRGRPVIVPYSPNAGAVSGAAGRRAYAGSVGWYAREIEAPVGGTYALAFESAHHRAEVYVDGRRVRAHAGAYEPFAARVRLARGRHTVAVRVDWRDPERQAASGWARGWFNFGGLNRPVTLSRLGPTQLDRLRVRTRLRDGGAARVEVSVRALNRGARRAVRLRGALRHGQTTVPLRFAPASVASGAGRTLRAAATVADPALWSPDDPQLHDLRVEDPGAALLERRVGLREIGWRGARLRLNGRPLILRGAGLPADVRGRGDALTPRDEARLVADLRALGANGTRSQLPLSESMLERLDAAGILVWQLVGPWEPAGRWRADTPARVARARDRALRTVAAQQAHPSIVAWTLVNEVSGRGQPGERSYLAQTTRRIHRLDPTRPVAADLWGSRLTRSAGPPFAALDAIGMTDYVGWYEELHRGPAGQAAVTAARLEHLRRLFPGKPLVVTELGAAGSDRSRSGAFGGVRHQARLLGRRLRVLRDDPRLSGTLVWALRDYALRPDFRGGSVLELRPGLRLAPGLNEKGLYDWHGRPKPALAAVRRAFAGAR